MEITAAALRIISSTASCSRDASPKLANPASEPALWQLGGATGYFAKLRPHAGGQVRVTSLERSLVDLLHSPEHGGGWEEIWRSLEAAVLSIEKP